MIDKKIIDNVDISGKICDFKYKLLQEQLKCLENEYEGFAMKYTDIEIALKRKEETVNQLEKIAEKYQTEFEKDALSLPGAIESIIERKEKERQELELELKQYKCSEKFPNQCHCACRCLGNEFCNDAENKINKLKSELQQEKQNSKDTYEMYQASMDSFNILQKELEEEKGKKEKYKKTLEETKEITKTCLNAEVCFDCKYCDDCEIKGEEPLTYNACQLILQKCEVLENE